ncbi:MAG TPA: pitrilysin family protein [Thermoanaerobaculia bacterium]|nr:pitrilysin family protein [Thermoanaerobaculia bacterium]
MPTPAPSIPPRRRPRVLIWLALLLPAAVVGPATAQVAQPGDLRYPPLPRFDIPQPQRVALDNGLVVMLLEDHELPLISVTALLRAGSRLDPPEEVGLGAITGGVMRAGGTERLSGDALDDYLESHAAELEVGVHADSGRASLHVLKQDFPDLLQLFADVLRRPAFDPAKLELARRQAIAAVARQNDDPDQILDREFRKIVYGPESPYARTPTFATLQKIRREDLIAWHRAHLHPDRMVLGLAGDFDSAAALEAVKRAFGDWPRGPAGEPPPSALRRQPSPGVYYAEKDDMSQSKVEMGHLGVEIRDPDYFALQVLNEVLSGSFASRLIKHVRTEKGLAYDVGGGVGGAWDHPGIASLEMSTKTETTGAGIAALLAEARDLTAHPPTDQEVELAKQSILASFVFRADSRSKILGQQLTFELFGYPLNWLSRYRTGVESTTTAAVRDAAARHLHPQDFAILVVGPQKGQDRPLSDFGKVTRIDIAQENTGAPGAPKR